MRVAARHRYRNYGQTNDNDSGHRDASHEKNLTGYLKQLFEGLHMAGPSLPPATRGINHRQGSFDPQPEITFISQHVYLPYRALCTFTDKPVRGFSRASAPCLSHCRLEAWKGRCAHAMT
jgi:hypothetical protein